MIAADEEGRPPGSIQQAGSSAEYNKKGPVLSGPSCMIPRYPNSEHNQAKLIRLSTASDNWLKVAAVVGKAAVPLSPQLPQPWRADPFTTGVHTAWGDACKGWRVHYLTLTGKSSDLW